MNELNHTPEPWVYRESNNGDIVHYLGTGLTYTTIASYVDPPDAARIVACVNACHRMENPARIGELVDKVTALAGELLGTEWADQMMDVLSVVKSLMCIANESATNDAKQEWRR